MSARPLPLYYYCAYCGANMVEEPEFAIHRDGTGEGPEVYLCSKCGAEDGPSCEQIWGRISRHRKPRPKHLVN